MAQARSQVKNWLRQNGYLLFPLLAFAILFGVYPRALFDYITPSVQKTVTEMRAVAGSTDRAAKLNDAPAQPQEPRQP